jgi:hypothetical protein
MDLWLFQRKAASLTCIFLNLKLCIRVDEFQNQPLTFVTMNTSANHIVLTGKAHTSASLFATAVLLLIVSCPLKRLLQGSPATYSNSAVRTNQTNINERSNAGYNIADDCGAISKKIDVVKTNLSQKVVVSSPSYLSKVSDASGFDINYYLSEINYKAAPVETDNPSSLPLFLRHLRLLI